MAAPKGNQYALGKKTGRKTSVVEAVRDAAINRAWDIVLDFLNDKSADAKEKREIATKIAVKNIPQALTGKDGADLFPKPLLIHVRSNNGTSKDTAIDQENQGDTRRNGSEQDNQHNPDID